MSSPVILADVENRGMAVAVNKGNDSSIRPNIQSTLSEQALGVQNEQCTEAEPEKQKKRTAAETDTIIASKGHKSSSCLVQGPVVEESTVEAIDSVTPDHSSTETRDDRNIVSGSDKEESIMKSPVPVAEPAADNADHESPNNDKTSPVDHSQTVLPQFRTPSTCMWTATHAANAPSEDRSASLVNVLVRPTTCGDDSLIRLSLWSVIDGHGGGCVAEYASEVLLPHIAARVCSTLECEIVHAGECRVNDHLRDASAIDFDDIIQSSERSQFNPNSIHYRTPSEDEYDDESKEGSSVSMEEAQSDKQSDDGDQSVESDNISLASSLLPRDDSVESSVKTSVKTAASAKQTGPVGTHSTDEVARVTNAITESFCAVDEGWINSIDVATTRQTSCQTNGAWNAGACALVVLTIQRLEWTKTGPSTADRDAGGADAASGGQLQDMNNNRDGEVDASPGARAMVDGQLQQTSHSRDAARLEAQDASPKTAVDCGTESAFESEMIETEDEETSGSMVNHGQQSKNSESELLSQQESLIGIPGGCECFYRPHDAMLYTAHVGDCRAVLLGNAPPRTIKVPPDGTTPVDNAETTEESEDDDDDDDDDDESSYHSSDVTELLSSSDQDAESSDDDDDDDGFVFENSRHPTPPHMRYMNRPSRRMRITREPNLHKPFVALPPLNNNNDNKKEVSSSDEREDDLQPAQKLSRTDHNTTGQGNGTLAISGSNGTEIHPPNLHLSPLASPIDLTNDHSAYNPAEVAAVLRRCNNAPKAISSGRGGGIRRVAGSLAVTRALGDAYLKTPLLSFYPFLRHAPFITARPEVNSRLLPTGGDPKTSQVLILATDGVWERANSGDVLRWIRNYSVEQVAAAERKSSKLGEGSLSPESVASENAAIVTKKRKLRPRRRPGTSKRGVSSKSTAADLVVRRVLNKVRRSRNMTMQDLMALPKGRSRRSKHDDITTSVVDLGAFVA